MKIERISETEIKITISIDDLEERNIDFDALSANTIAAQELLLDMMEQVEDQFGTPVGELQFMIEPDPNYTDGFIITITKVEDEEFESIQKYIKNKYRKNDLKVKKKGRRVFSTVAIYSFDSLDDVCTLSGKLSSIYSGESTLYKHNGSYYLVLTKSSLTVSNPRLFELLLNEFGRKVSHPSFFEGYINEYGTKLIDCNAIEVLSQYF